MGSDQSASFQALENKCDKTKENKIFGCSTPVSGTLSLPHGIKTKLSSLYYV